MELVAGKTLLRKNGEELEEVAADEALADISVVGFYFSGEWCPPSKIFSRKLAECYKELKEAEKPFEVIFISNDLDEDKFKEYMLEIHGDWLAAQFEDDIKNELAERFNIDAIPTLVIAKQDGEVITDQGKLDVVVHGSKAFDSWEEGVPAVANPEEFEDKEDEAKEEDD